VLTNLLTLAMVACIAAMVAEQLRQHRRRKREHDGLLDDAEGVLDSPVRGRDATGLPVVSGGHDGREARLDLMIDALAMRKLPRLFLRGAIHAPLDVPAPIFAQRLSVGSGMADGDRRLDRELPAPAHWPPEVVIRTTPDGPDHLPRSLYSAGAVFDDPRTLSFLAAPRGLRLTWEVARGDMAAWRVSRGARFGEHVPAHVADHLLSTAGDLADSLSPPRRTTAARSRNGSS